MRRSRAKGCSARSVLEFGHVERGHGRCVAIEALDNNSFGILFEYYWGYSELRTCDFEPGLRSYVNLVYLPEILKRLCGVEQRREHHKLRDWIVANDMPRYRDGLPPQPHGAA